MLKSVRSCNVPQPNLLLVTLALSHDMLAMYLEGYQIMSEMKLYTAMYISGMPDISQGLPVGTELSWDEPDEWLSSGRAMVLLAVDPGFVEMDADSETLVLSQPLHMRYIDVVAVCSNSQECVSVNRSVQNMLLEEVVLYHGTTEESAVAISRDGWKPGDSKRGANFGQNRYLYCTTDPQNALWFANENSGESILKIEARVKHLIVDPEDGAGEHVLEEALISLANGLPANFATTHEVSASSISILSQDKVLGMSMRTPGNKESAPQNAFL